MPNRHCSNESCSCIRVYRIELYQCSHALLQGQVNPVIQQYFWRHYSTESGFSGLKRLKYQRKVSLQA